MKIPPLLLRGAPLAIFLLFASAAHAQLTSNDPPPAMGSHTLPNPTPRPAEDYARGGKIDPAQARELREAERLRNQLRQHLVVSTTDELVRLTNELRADLVNDPHLLSPADEKERLKQIQDLAKLIVSTMKAE